MENHIKGHEEIFSSEILENNKKVFDFLINNGVDAAFAMSLPIEVRTQYLINTLINEVTADTYHMDNEQDLDDYSDLVGIILIKPEIQPFAFEITDYLKVHGHNSAVLGLIYPTKEQWLQTYGYMLDKYPDVIYNYIMHRSLGLQPVLVQYCVEDLICDIDLETEDKCTIFDKKYCGKDVNSPNSSIRSEICLPILKRLGFDDMSGFASSFDPLHFFKESGVGSAYRAFNGIHVPSNRFEKNKNMKTFIE